MPTMKSFTGFASTPNLGSSFIGGANNMASLIQAGQQLQLGREKIAADMAQANMQMQAQQQALQSRALREEQELNVKKQYQDAVLGLQERELGQKEQMLQLKTQEAAQQFQAQQGFQREMEELTAGGMDVNEAFNQTALKYGPMMGLPAGAYSGALRDKGGADYGAAAPVEGLPEGYRQIQTGPGSRQIIKLPEALEEGKEATPIPGAPGYAERGKRIFRIGEPQELKDLRKKRDRLEIAHEKDERGIAALAAEADGKKLSKSQQMFKTTYQKRASEIRALESQISKYRTPTRAASSSAEIPEQWPAGFEGKKVRSKKDPNVIGRIVDGTFTPLEDQ